MRILINQEESGTLVELISSLQWYVVLVKVNRRKMRENERVAEFSCFNVLMMSELGKRKDLAVSPQL